jgi:hypothetical protein
MPWASAACLARCGRPVSLLAGTRGKSLHKSTTIAVFAACLAAAILPQKALAQDKSFLDVIKAEFFKTDDPNDPGKTLRAPFVKPGDMDTPTADKMGLTYTPYSEKEKGALNLAQPHRDQDQVGLWLSDKVSEILNIKPSDYDDHMKAIKPFMTPDALVAYTKFMEDSTILNRMRLNHLQLHSFVEQSPLLLNQGPVDDRYRWLYEVPVTLTFLREGLKDYDENNVPASSSNYRLLIRIQIGRVVEGQDSPPPPPPVTEGGDDANGAGMKSDTDNDQNNQGLKIESWEVRHNDMAL